MGDTDNPYSPTGSGAIAGATLAGPLTVDNIKLEGSAITGITNANTTFTAYTGKAVVIESVAMDGGAVSGVTTLAMAGALSGVTTAAVSGQITSTLATGTAPLVIASTTEVANLNSAQVNGMTPIDEDTFATDSATRLPTQQSAKAYTASFSKPLPQGLTAKVNATHTDHQIDITFTSCYAQGIMATAGTYTADFFAAGANGVDAGALTATAASAHYFGHIITKADGTTASLISASATAPTLPATYTKFRLVTWFKWVITTGIVSFVQEGDLWAYVAATNLKTGAAYYDETLDCSEYIPTIALTASISLYSTAIDTASGAGVTGTLYSYLNGVYYLMATSAVYKDAANQTAYLWLGARIGVSSRSVKYSTVAITSPTTALTTLSIRDMTLNI